MGTIREAVPTVRYELVFNIDYRGEIGEYEPLERASMIEAALGNEELLLQLLDEMNAFDLSRIDNVSAELRYIDELDYRDLEAAYEFPENEFIGK